MKKLIVVTFFLAFAGLLTVTVHGQGGPVAAQPRLLEDGRIAITGPVTIKEPGSYILTRNIATDDDNVISIVVDDVDLDLGGFTIAGNWGIIASGVKGLVIHDGTIVDMYASDNGPRLYDLEGFVLRRLVIRSGDDRALAISGSRNGVVEDNYLSPGPGGGDTAMYADNLEYVDFFRNRITGFQNLNIGGSNGRIVGNTVEGILAVGGSGNVVRDNIAASIQVAADNYVENNYIVEDE